MTNLADRYFALKNEIDALTRLLDECKAEIKATGRDEIIGEHAIVSVGLSERVALDQKAVKAILTPAQIIECSKTTLIETVRVKPTVNIEVHK
jgi:hypothetical protein